VPQRVQFAEFVEFMVGLQGALIELVVVLSVFTCRNGGLGLQKIPYFFRRASTRWRISSSISDESATVSAISPRSSSLKSFRSR
jgi:hypothetical protein